MTVTVKEKGKEKDVDLKVQKSTRFIAFGEKGGAPASSVGKDGLKIKTLKEGAEVRYITDKDGNLTMVMTGKLPQFHGPGAAGGPGGAGPGGRLQPVHPQLGVGGGSGKIKSIDTDKGTITVTVREGTKEKDRDLKVGKDTKFYIGGRPLSAKEALKAKQLKKGTQIGFQADKEGHLRTVALMGTGPGAFGPGGFGPGAGRIGPGGIGLVGKITNVDEDKGVVTVTVGKKEYEVKLGKDTRVFANNKPYQGKEAALKAKVFKKGETVRFIQEGKGPARFIALMPQGYGETPRPNLKPVSPRFGPERDQGIRGKVKSFDAKKGLLTLTVRRGDGKKEMTFRVGPQTQFRLGGENAKVTAGTKALKDDQLKEGTRVRVMLGVGNVAQAVIVRKGEKSKEETKKGEK
jgi:hypothetical protein